MQDKFLLSKYLLESQGKVKRSAFALIYARDTNKFLFQLRSASVDNPLTWSNVGGGVNLSETWEQGCKREVSEETGYNGPLKLIATYGFTDSEANRSIQNFIGIVPKQFEAVPQEKFASEVEKHEWFAIPNFPKPLHFGVQALLKDSKTRYIIKKLIN